MALTENCFNRNLFKYCFFCLIICVLTSFLVCLHFSICNLPTFEVPYMLLYFFIIWITSTLSDTTQSSSSCCWRTVTPRWPFWCSRGRGEWWTSSSSSMPDPDPRPSSTLEEEPPRQPRSTSSERHSPRPPSPTGCKRCPVLVRLWKSWRINAKITFFILCK